MNLFKTIVGWTTLGGTILLGACTFETVRYAQSGDRTPFLPIALIGGHDNPWSQTHHPAVGATPIDVNGDGAVEIFVGGGEGNADMLFFYENGKLINRIDDIGLSDLHATHGANSMDMDGDGDADLILARSNGVFLYENNGGQFVGRKIPVNLPDNAAPLNVAIGDIDRDGDGDLYISAFVDLAHFRSATFNDPTHAKTNVMLQNNGDMTFTDITESSQTASLQNTFLASFLDLNDDGWQDLIVAQNTGQVEIFRNMQNGVFAPVTVTTGWGFWMGLAAGDIDHDGDDDLFFTNSGNSVPALLLENVGDATDNQPRNYGWILLQNDGDFNWSDITAQSELDDYGFAWGAIFEDLTLDGELELLVAQNYIKWPFHKWSKLSGKSFIKNDNAYRHAADLGLENPTFGQSPLIADMDGDGRPDVFWVNMEGEGSAHLNRSKHNFLTFMFPDTVDSIGARAHITTAAGDSYTRRVHNNTGLSTDQWTGLTFGLGEQTAVKHALIIWADGGQRIIYNPPINQIIAVER